MRNNPNAAGSAETARTLGQVTGDLVSRRRVLGSIGGAGLVALVETANPDRVFGSAPLPIVTGHSARATIVVSREADDQTRHAAEVLVDTVRQATGATLPTVMDDEEVTGTRILIGFAGKGAGVQQSELAALGPDAFLIRRVNDVLTIAGRDGWGTRFGVYEFLEKFADVRWLMPDGVAPGQIGSDVPNTPDVSVSLA